LEKLNELIADEEGRAKSEMKINPRTGKPRGKDTKRLEDIEKQKEMALVYEKYQEKMKEKGRYDYEDMIMFVVEKLKTDDFLRAYYQEKYQYFLLDEYQDTNSSQNAVVTILGEFFDSPNIFAVGDDDQAIYRFQGASLENILEFTDKYPDVQKVVLTENYRSDQKILDAARALIVNNKQRLETRIPDIIKELKAQKSETGSGVYLCELDDGNEEAYFIAKKISELRESGVNLSEIAVFYRRNRDVSDLVRFFEKLDIKYEISGGENLLNDIQIQKIISLLKVINNPRDDIEFFRMLNLDFLDIEREDIYRLTNLVHKKKKRYYEVTRDMALLKESGLKNIIKINNLSILLDQWTAYNLNLTFAEFFEKVINESGFMEYILKRDDVRELNRIKTFFDQIKSFNKGDHHMKLKSFLEMLDLMEEYSIQMPEESLKMGESSVKLMTAHKAKGLEFDHVFIFKAISSAWEKYKGARDAIKLPDNIFAMQDLSEGLEIEDERRLFYVTLTRARKQAYITCAKTYDRGTGKMREESPSVFVAEILDYAEKFDTQKYKDEARERLKLYLAKPVAKEHSEGLTGYLKEVLKDFVLSVTALNNYINCPRKFLYQNILKVPRVKAKHLAFGSAVHFALQEFFEKFKREKYAPDLDFLLSAFEKGIRKEVTTEADLEESLEKGKKILTEYFEYNKNGLKIPLFNEYNLASHKVIFDGIPLTGKVDRIDLIDEKLGTVNVVDYKTGRPKSENAIRGLNEGAKADNYRQLVFYKLMCELDKWFKWKVVSCELDFVEGPGKRFQTSIMQADIEGLKGEIKNSYKAIQELKFDKIVKGKECEKCEFRKVCW
ncbi:MAG: ATP-dependent DNA helicase, partial [Candidatus Gracilibacteria bacterium]